VTRVAFTTCFSENSHTVRKDQFQQKRVLDPALPYRERAGPGSVLLAPWLGF
jgi:hypothetical protein